MNVRASDPRPCFIAIRAMPISAFARVSVQPRAAASSATERSSSSAFCSSPSVFIVPARPSRSSSVWLGLLLADEVERTRVIPVCLADSLAPLRLLGGTHECIDRALDRRRRVAPPHLASELARLFEVVGDDLDELVSLARAGTRGEPVDEPDVEGRAAALGHASVRDVLDQARA